MKSGDIFQSVARPPALRAALKSLPVTLFYLSFAAAIVWALPDRAWSLKTQALVAMSLFGIWRYSWQLIHAIRHYRYRKHVFPRLRAEAMAQEKKYPERLYIMVPSYKEEYNVSQLVFTALIREARTIPSKVLIYASVGSDEEVEFISKVLIYASVGSDEEVEFISKVINAAPGGDEVETVFMHQEEGKRVAMGYALRAIARDFNDPVSWHPDAGNDAVIFMDGDTLVEPGMFRKTLPYFRSNPKLGALTTDNIGVSPDATGVFSDWYGVKFAQRNHIFHSHSLSKRVLTITGRFSIYRASVVVNEEFIRFLEADHLDHWLFGRFRFLMGDDKSTWYYLLKEGMEMLYVPDAMAVALEVRQKNFFRTSLSLMHRWYGNMLRNNWRAVKLGPRPMGFFVWWCILDQRFSSFTPLVGPVSILLLSALDSWFYLAFYFAWALFTRLCMMWVYVLEGMRLRVLHIPLVLYNQWVGAALKIYSMYSLSSQTWQKSGAVKQETGEDRDEAPGTGFFRTITRMGLIALNWLVLICVCGVVSGAFIMPGVPEYKALMAQWPSHVAEGEKPFHMDADECGVKPGVILDNAPAINEAIANSDRETCLELHLPEGRIVIDSPIILDRDGVRLLGSGMDKTVLVSRMKAEQGRAVIAVGGRKGPLVGTMNGAANKGDKVISLDGWPEGARYAWFGAPNDDDFFDMIGDRNWRRAEPWVRQFVVPVAGAGKGYIILARGLPMAFPAGTEVRAARVAEDVKLSGFTIEQEVPGKTLSQVEGVYENAAPDYAVDGIRFDWAARSTVNDVAVIGAGRHPLVFESSFGVTARNVRIDGAWNKGKGGNGYVRFARSFDCVLENAVVENVRHLAFQWAATGNVVRDSVLRTDVNFHGGFSQDNLVEGCLINPPAGHKWGRVFRTPEDGANWAPPDGPGNRVVN